MRAYGATWLGAEGSCAEQPDEPAPVVIAA
jgi:hypothetical protein